MFLRGSIRLRFPIKGIKKVNIIKPVEWDEYTSCHENHIWSKTKTTNKKQKKEVTTDVYKKS